MAKRPSGTVRRLGCEVSTGGLGPGPDIDRPLFQIRLVDSSPEPLVDRVGGIKFLFDSRFLPFPEQTPVGRDTVSTSIWDPGRKTGDRE